MDRAEAAKSGLDAQFQDLITRYAWGEIYIAGCDGFHGICRGAFPDAALRVYERAYPFAWLGILAEAAPSRKELVYMHHPRGFALYSMRSPTVTRLYLQCAPDEDIAQCSVDRIGTELDARLRCHDGWCPAEGRVLQKGVTGMRSFVAEPLQYGRLFLAGDAAHIVPPTGANGMNLAFADVYYLAQALALFIVADTSKSLTATRILVLNGFGKRSASPGG